MGKPAGPARNRRGNAPNGVNVGDAPRAHGRGRAIPPHLLQALVEKAEGASLAVGPDAVLVVLDRLSDLRLGDVRAVAVEARQLASGDVQLTARPEYVTMVRAA